MTDAELMEKVQILVDTQAAADRFSGAVLVAHHSHPILATACGYAIHPNVLPNQPDTRFNIASVTKMLTATAVMRLVADGKLDLHTPIAAYNRDLPHADEVTIHQLLTHTAGFGRYWNDAYRAARSDLRTAIRAKTGWGRSMGSGAPITSSMPSKAVLRNTAFRRCRISSSFVRRSRPTTCLTPATRSYALPRTPPGNSRESVMVTASISSTTASMGVSSATAVAPSEVMPLR